VAVSRRQVLTVAGASVAAAAIDVGGLIGPSEVAVEVGSGRAPALGPDAAAFATPSAAPALTTMGRTVVPGDPGPGGYKKLKYEAGEAHILRTDLAPFSDSEDGGPTNPTYALTAFAQMSDLHIIDDQSPLRVEFLDE
jgi:hypothetical protein